MSKTLSPLFRKNFVSWLAGTVRIAHPIYDEQLQYFYESPPLVNVRGVKHKLEKAVTMLADLENVGQIDDKHAAIAALCEDGMKCLQKRVAALEKELEETLHELMEARLDIFKKQSKAAANVISVTREKLAETEARCREVFNENHIAHDRLLAELGRPPSAPSMWEL
ncbi:hypothetical protein R1sor_018717 [Riccia sorocarpa]|uniref:Uncharacterized protein n=1 Tax=Riccia sorocarpa TaxID=122646 RepID=A0ABD3IAG8_9MARC